MEGITEIDGVGVEGLLSQKLQDTRRALEAARKGFIRQISTKKPTDSTESNGPEFVSTNNGKQRRQSLEITLRAVQKALENVKNGTYGICENCEELIAEKRLRAIPEAVLCLSCMRIEESISEQPSRYAFVQ